MIEYKALYVHIPKTGGSSICKAPWILKHGSYDKDPELPMESIPSLKLSFAFVRDPFARFVSGVLNHGYATPESFTRFVLGRFSKEYQQRFAEWSWPELQPQYRYLYHGGELAIDFVGRFEKLRQGWDSVCSMVGERFELPHLNKGKYQDHTSFYTPKTRQAVTEAYREDFSLLGY